MELLFYMKEIMVIQWCSFVVVVTFFENSPDICRTVWNYLCKAVKITHQWLFPELPTFLKTPMDLTIRTGTVARLECAAEGHPTPQIAWQKDGGINFPAARERRMHVMPDDDTFFIANVKAEDMGVYSCTAKNEAGSLSANATLTVLGIVFYYDVIPKMLF